MAGIGVEIELALIRSLGSIVERRADRACVGPARSGQLS
jgi:hypothetical protein